MTIDTVIEYRDVRVDGDDGPIVAGFSAGIPAGRLTVMVGPSGAGKTTLLRLPEVLALDEPTSALDTASKAGIVSLIRGLADSGLTIVMVTHDPAHTELADHVVRVEPYSPGRRP